MSELNKPLPHSDQNLLPTIDNLREVPGKKIIRDLSLKVTRQRLIILDFVRKGPAHFTAQELYEDIAEKHPDIGFATVYRFLRKMSEHSYVTEIRLGGMPARYEWAAKRHHDHLSCVRCHSIVEFENQKIEDLQDQIAEEHGFVLTDHVLELYGICEKCRLKNT